MSGSLPRRAWVGCLVALCALTAPTFAAKRGAAPPDYGHEFVTIGAPGNRHMLPEERFYNNGVGLPSPYPGTPAQVGRVNYKYRITKDVVRVEQWVDFCNVAWPIWEQEWGQTRSNSSFSSPGIAHATGNPNSHPGYHIVNPGRAVTTAFRVAAMYCNWLHNGRPTGPDADLASLRTGAYDISTFTRNPDGTFNDQYSRSPGAKYWVPDLHEWTKAVYYDPNRYGEGEDGYWQLPYMRNDPPTELPPDPDEYGFQTPWGLTDVMTVVYEWTETLTNPFENEYGLVSNGRRHLRSSSSGSPHIYDYNDHWFHQGGATFVGGRGLRIASLVPAPGAACALFAASLTGLRRERRPAMI